MYWTLASLFRNAVQLSCGNRNKAPQNVNATCSIDKEQAQTVLACPDAVADASVMESITVWFLPGPRVSGRACKQGEDHSYCDSIQRCMIHTVPCLILVPLTDVANPQPFKPASLAA